MNRSNRPPGEWILTHRQDFRGARFNCNLPRAQPKEARRFHRQRDWLVRSWGLLLLFTFPLFASAGELHLHPVIVTDHREEKTEEENPTRFLEIISVKGIEEKFSSIPELLENSVGVNVQRYGGLGSYSTVSIRGASASQVQIYLDGVPLNTAAVGVVNLEDFPVEALDRIEIFRGFLPAGFGATNIGGAVNLVTRSAEEATVNSSSGAYGSWTTTKINFCRSQSFSQGDYVLFFHHLQSQGNYEFLNDNGTPLNPNDDYETTRINNDLHAYEFLGRGGFSSEKWRLDVLNDFYKKEQGLPGLDYHQAQQSRLSVWRNLSTLQIKNNQPLRGIAEMNLRADALYRQDEFQDPAGEIGLGIQDNDYQSLTLGISGLMTIPLVWISQTLTLFADLRREEYQATYHLPQTSKGPNQRRLGIAGVIQDEINPWKQRLLIVPMLRWEGYWNEFSGDAYFPWSPRAVEDHSTISFFNPSVGSSFLIFPELGIKANLGIFHRIPTFLELFGDRGTTMNNPELEPESSISWDLGFEFRRASIGFLRDFRLEYGFFRVKSENLIIFTRNSQHTVRAENVGHALTWGNELSLSSRFSDFLSLSGNYTQQMALDKSDIPYWNGNCLPNRPAHQFDLRAELRWTKWMNTWYEYHFLGGNYRDRANFYKVPERHIHNLGTTFAFYQEEESPYRTSLSLEVKNLFDQRVYDILRYPLPGRSFYGTLSFRF